MLLFVGFGSPFLYRGERMTRALELVSTRLLLYSYTVVNMRGYTTVQ